jgi:hypothetical protein
MRIAAKLRGGGPILQSGLKTMGYGRVTATSDRHRQHFRTVSAEDAVLKKELLDLADVCEEVANNIEDRLTSG